MPTLPYFGLYVVTCPGREHVLDRTLESIRSSDWPDAPTVLRQPEDWPIGWGSTSRMYQAVLQRAWSDGCWWAVVLEDDVQVNRHLWANLTSWHPLTTGQLHWGSLFVPDTIQDPWTRSCPELGYRLARPALATGPHARWQKARLWGSQGYVFSRGALEVMLDRWDQHTGGQDARVISIADSAGWPFWFAAPCLVEHTPIISAFGTPPVYAPDFDPDFLFAALEPDVYRHAEGVPGWLSYAEGRALWELARGKRVLELGRFCGRSTIALAQSAREVVSVDAADPAPAASWLDRFGCADRVALHQGTFAQVIPSLGAFELVFVDGEHDAKNVRADVELALSVLESDGVLVCHDYPDPSWPDVRRVVDDIATKHGLVRIRQSDFLGAFQRTKRTTPIVSQSASSGSVNEFVNGSSKKKTGGGGGNGGHPHADPEPAGGYDHSSRRTPRTVWVYWEGSMPGYIELCIRTIRAHNAHVELLDRAGFDALWRHDRDLPIDTLYVSHRADYIRAYLLAHYGGLYTDADCVALRDFDYVFNLVDGAEFVGYREPLGYTSNSLMASVPDGAVIREHYRQVCETLRSGRPRAWLDLGAVPLDRAIAAHPGQSLLLPTALMMPLSWQESERLADRRPDEAHELSFRADALCYMLSNQTIGGRRPSRVLTYMPPADLLTGSYFLSFLFRRALKHEAIGSLNSSVRLGTHEGHNHFDEGAFNYLAERFGVRTMIDVGCGPPGMVYFAERRGVKAVGVDGDPLIARGNRVVIEHDYTRKPLFAGEFDLGWSVEFVANVEEKVLPNVMATFRGCRHVFVTAAGSAPHIKCRPAEYWIEQFQLAGFTLDAEETEGVRRHSTMESGFTRDAGLVFRRM